ncbi:hypothetical protein LSAT2_011214 [Lamellibrachia satsuma]|nr:hypothetical protein LSAT2_011214 [Lamellibrachia satsuma]
MIRNSAEAVATCSTSTPTSNPTTTTQVTVSPTPSRANGNAVAPSAIKLTKAVQAKRSTLLLFVVISIFVVCWLAFFLKNYGLPISKDVKCVNTINSIVNLFIYNYGLPISKDVKCVYTINPVVNPFISKFLSPMFRSCSFAVEYV